MSTIRNFYFGPQADVVAGSANFASMIATGFASFGLTSAQSAAFGAVNTTLQSAYTAAITPETRTRITIQAKDLALVNMRRLAVQLAKIIYSSGVTDAQLVSLGLLPRTVPTPRPVPGTSPIVEVLSCSGRCVKVRVHDSSTERRGKPFGAVGANLFSFVGEAPPTDPRQYHFEGMTTRTLAQILFPNAVPSGATVWLSACWVSARGQLGIACPPVSFTLQGGAIPAAA